MARHPLPIPEKKSKFSLNKFSKIAPRLIELLKPELKLVFIGFVGLAGGSFLNLLFPFIIREFLNKGDLLSLEPYLLQITITLILLFILQGGCFFVRHYFLQLVGLNIVTRLKNRLMKSLVHQDITFFDSARLGDLLSRLNADTEVVQRGLSVNSSVVIRYTIQVIGGLALMFYISVKLTIVLLLIIPILVLFSLFWSQKLRVLSKKVQEILGVSSTTAEEALTGVRVVKIFGAEEKELNQFEDTTFCALESAKKRTRMAAMFSSSMVTVLHSAIAIVFYFGILSVVNESLTSGDLTAFLLYCTIVAVSFGFLTNAWAEFVQSIGAAERIFEIIDKLPEIRTPDSPKNLDQEKKFDISFEKVSFSYPARKDIQVLHDISFNISAGNTVALVGPSGSGKSTLAALIPRLYDPDEGIITIQGVDIKDLSIKDLRSHISFVPQTTHLFSTTLRENLSYGNKKVTDQMIMDAITKTGLDDLLERLPEKLDAKIGDKGIQLSGGERQRISVVRALLQEPDILVLDEATSSLDSGNERKVQDAIKVLVKDRTTLVIAHRLSTIQHADKVVVIRDGRIIQTGTHDDLMAQSGLYKSMVEYQFLG